MKKQLKSAAAISGALMMLTGSAFAAMPASAAERQILMGDLDGDLFVTIDDAIGAAQICAGAINKTASNAVTKDNCAADIDMNGSVDLDDAISILQYYTSSLVGGDLLWADLRKTSYHDGTRQRARSYFDPEVGEWIEEEWVDVDSTPFELKDLYVEIGCAEGKPGEKVTVPVYVAGCGALVGFQYVQDVPGDLTVTNMTTPLLEDNYNPDEFDSACVWNPEFNVYGKNCTLVWVNSKGLNLNISDGAIIAEITYQIPENAKSGENYIISDSSDVTMFLRNKVDPETQEELGPQDFQYTLIDGVIHVK